jgi:hypothetical protein
MIDEMLASVAPSGEVRLTMHRGRLRFVARSLSQKVQPPDDKTG